MKKLSSRWLLIIALFLSIFITVKAQTVINPLVSNEKPKLQFGLSQIVDLVNANQSINASNVSNFQLVNLKENNTKIKVDILTTGNGNALFKELIGLGVEVVARHQNFITAWVEIKKIEAYLDKAPSIVAMQTSVKPQNNAGVVQSQGDAAQRSDLARALGVNGAGVKVGVLSDSYNNLGGAAAGVTAGELPGTTNPNGFTTPVTVLSDIASGGSDEGRAMLEIVHDVAPAAQLYYYTAFNGQADFAAGIRALADAGCKVIVDDVGYFAEPYFQDGIIAQAVDYAVNVKGASYFSSAANSSDQSYEAPYQASTFQPFNDGQTAHNFGTAANPIYFLPINGSSRPVIFQWDEPYLSAGNGSPGSASDLNIYICTYNSTTNSYTVVAQSITNNIGSDPTETFGFANINLANRYILITKKSGPDPTRIKVVGQRGITWTLTPSTIAGIRAGTCVGHANAAGAIACGAASYDKTPAFGVNPPEIESYSSKGGTPIIFSPAGVRLPSPDDRLKPEITAPDNANTSFFVTGYDPDGDGKPNFPGTSAAAPHAAGVAALMFQGNPGITPAGVKTALINSCVDMDDPNTIGFDTGFDYRTGAGLIRADVAVQATINPNCPPTVVTITRPTTFCQGDSVIFDANTGTNFTFQWKKNGENISGATSAQYIAKTSGNYSVIITRLDCSVETAAITVKVNLGVPPPTTVSRTITAGTTITAGNGLQASSSCYTLVPQTVTYSGGTVGYDGELSSGADPTTVFSGLSGNIAKVKVSITWRKRSGGGTQNDCGTTGATGIPYNDEISFSLKAPDNTIITLLNYGSYARGTTSSGVVTTVFEDGNPAVGTTPASGTFASAQLLSLLEGKVPNGTWTLIPYDGFTGEPLCVQGFSVTITTDGDTTPSTDITWWDAASGGTQVGSGSEYIPTNTAVGSYTYYAQAGCSNGLTCNTSIRKSAVLTINTAPCSTPTNVTIGSNSPVAEGSAINLTSSSTGGTSQAWTGPNSYSSTEQNPTIASATLAMAGIYTVIITSSGTCTAMATTSVVVNPAPTLCTPPTNVTIGSNSPVTEGSAINLTSSSTGGTSQAWTGPNSYSSTEQNPTIASSTSAMTGVYIVIITSSGTCTAMATTSVVVNPAPTLCTPPTNVTIGSNSPVTEGSAINLTSSSTGGTSQAWTGPNSYSSTEQNPTIASSTSAMAGIYTVIITSSGTCTAMATTSVVVNPAPTLCTPPTNVTIGSNSPVTEGSAINLTSSSTGGTSQAWTGPNSYSSTEQNPTIASSTSAMAGIYTVIITSSGTCTAMATTSVVVMPIPTVTVVFVNIANNAAPTQNGVSWATAYSNLQTALSAAPANSEIWVAQGTYKPTTTTNRNISFNIPSGAMLFGGFVGTETLKNQRNFGANSTILSGEIGSSSTVSDNSYHVVTFIGVSNMTVLDGFTVMAGNANLTADRGRAVSNSPILPLSIDDGGGIGLDNGSSPSITNCKIISNDGVNGGGLFATNGSNPVITNTIFMNNQATFGGGAYHLTGSPIYKNVLFAGNKGTGGAIYNNISNPTITNVTIASNGGYNGAVFNSGSTPVLKNCILWGNIAPFNDTQSLISYSIVEGGYAGVGNLNLNPQFINPTPNGLSPSLTGNYQVNNTSPSIDGGDNGGIGMMDKDLTGNPRIFSGGLVDMGAYEFQGSRVGGTVTSITSGNWELGSTWNIGRKPLAGDNVIINNNHIVTVNENGVLKNLEFKPNAKVVYSISSIKLQTGF